MKYKIIVKFILLFIVPLNLFAQIEINKYNGGTVKLKNIAFKVNEGSSLMREYITINDESCPIKLEKVGIRVGTCNTLCFNAVGNISAKKPVVAYEIHHLLYDVFNEYFRILTKIEVVDLSTNMEYSQTFWDAGNIQGSILLSSVSYVAKVRTVDNAIWYYDNDSLQHAFQNLNLKYVNDIVDPIIFDEK